MSERLPIPAIVLAGSRGRGDPLASYLGIEHKCLAPVASRPMIDRVVDALRSSNAIGQIIVLVNDVGAFNHLAGDDLTLVECAPSPSQSVIRAWERLDGAAPVLLTTGDHALLTSSMIETFIDEASGDLAAGLVHAQYIKAAAPSSKRTYLRFSDGDHSGANLFWLGHGRAAKALSFWRRVEAERKKPWRLAKAFGYWTLLRYLLRRLSLDQAMAAASATIGIDARAVRLQNGRAAIDVDKPADLILAEQLLAQDRLDA